MSTHKKKRKHHRHVHNHVHEWDWREFIAKYWIGICIAALVPIVGIGAIIGWGAYQSHLYQVKYAPELETELGFTTESTLIQAGEEKTKALTIHTVHDGYMDKIGFRDGDIITSHSSTTFYKMLYTQREETVTVNVVDGGNGLPIENRKARTLRFLDPPKR